MGELSKRKNAVKLLEQLNRINTAFDQATPYLFMILGLYLIFIFLPMLASYSNDLRRFEDALRRNPGTFPSAEIVLIRAMCDVLLSIVLLGLSAVCIGYLGMKPEIKNKFWKSPTTRKLQFIVIILVVLIEIAVAILNLMDGVVVEIAFYTLLKGYDALLFTSSKLLLLIASIAAITFVIPILYFYFSKVFKRWKKMKKIN